MARRIAWCAGAAAFLIALALAPGRGRAGVLDHFLGESAPPTLADVARMVDHIQSAILNQGTVVIKQPDIWSQARMTKFRKEFEDTMSPEVASFTLNLAGRIARSDAASFQSQTALAAVLTPFGKDANGNPFTPLITSQPELNTALVNTTGLITTPQTTASTTTDGSGSQVVVPGIPAANLPPAADFTLINQLTTGKKDTPGPGTGLLLGLEPNVKIDQQADYINHLNRIRRVNLGDDTADSAGYGLYLMRVPVSIQPGDQTKKGHGALVNLTMRHDFGPKFLASTFRNLVINDVIDMLAPPVTEAIRNGSAKEHHDMVVDYLKSRRKATPAGVSLAQAPYSGLEGEKAFADQVRRTQPDLASELDRKRVPLEAVIAKLKAVKSSPVSRSSPSTFPVAPSDIKRVFLPQNLLILAYHAQVTVGLGDVMPPDTNKIRSTDVRTVLRQELESAYDLMTRPLKDQVPLLQDVEYIESITDQVYQRGFDGAKDVPVDSPEEVNDFFTLYEGFTRRLPGNIRWRPVGALSWAIAIEAGLLNRHLREDMTQTKGAEGYTCPAEVEGMFFYPPTPMPEAEFAFQEYIKARWPMITFALEPVIDEQNVEDSFTRRRDLQLAVAFALSAGRISFRQAIQFTRQLQYEAQTIALNQTITSFAHGNDSFGWRFSPRYQTPPEEGNLQAVGNLLLRGGPGPNYGLKNSKIEPGMRELTAVVVMPSFVRGMRLDVAGDWFRLHDPDEQKIHSARTIELGRRINEARTALDVACKCGQYRPEDTERLRIRLHQLERMLPLQTQIVKVPYENTLGGFALFTQGVTALVPELSGFEGLEYIDPNQGGDILVFGKHLSIYETAVVAGGFALPREGKGTAVVKNGDGVPVVVGTALSPLRTQDGTLSLINAVGPPLAFQDHGSYDILSREVMRVHLPGSLQMATRDDGTKVVELYVSTPNGISNRIEIPVKPDAKAPPVAAVASGPGYTIVDPELKIGLAANVTGDKASVVGVRHFANGVQLRIQPTDRTSPLPLSISLSASFALPNGLLTQPIQIEDIQLRGDMYVVRAEQLNDFADQIFQLLKTNARANPDFLPMSAGPGQVAFQASQDPGQPAPPGPAPSTNALNVTFQPIVTTVPDAAATPATKPATAANSAKPRPAVAQTLPTLAPIADEAPDDSGGRTRQASFDPVKPAALRTALAQAPAPAEAGLSLPLSLPPLPQAPAVAAASLATNEASTPAIPTALVATPARASQTVVVVPQRAAPLNISVPVAAPVAKHRGLFHRQGGAGPDARPVRGPLLERLRGQP